MKLLRRHSSKGRSHVEVLLHIEDLGPWPAQHGTLAVQFLRGKRAGQTRPQNPDDESTSIASYTFDETLTVPATLYRGSFGGNGGYEEKKLSIFIAQVDDKGKELSVLGGLELNLADFADMQGKESRRQSYPIECSSAIWKPAGGRPKLTMSVAVARGGGGGEKTAADMKAELSGPLSPVDEIPSTLSTDVDEESLTTSPEAQGSVGGDTSGEIGILKDTSREATSNLTTFNGGVGTAVGAAAAAAAPAAALNSKSLVYDSDGFLVDSELSDSRPSQSGGTVTKASSLTINNNATAAALGAAGAAALISGRQQKEHSADSGTVVKRNLNKDLAEANNSARYQEKDSLSPLRTTSAGGGGGGVPSAASGTVIKKSLTPGVDQSSSPGSIDQPQHPVHTRRFSRGDGAALGSRKWAWRRQSNDPVGSDGGGGSGGGGGGNIGSLDNYDIEGANSPVSATELPFESIPGRSSSAGAPYISGTRGVAGAAGAAAGAAGIAAAGGVVESKTSYGTPDAAALVGLQAGSVGISPSNIAGSLSSPSAKTASLHKELQISAALESAIFLAGRGWATSSSHRQPKVEQLQAPARRLARTIIILGPEEGAAFGQRAVAAIRAAAAASLSDPQRLLLWWANAVTLRWSFWALGRGGEDGGGGYSASPISTTLPAKGEGNAVSPPGSQRGGGGGTSHFDWLSRSLSPALRHLEAQMYADLINYLWNGVLVPTAVQSASETAASQQQDKSGGENAHLTSTAESKPAIMSTLTNGNSSNSRTTGGDTISSTAEGAMDHWIRALRAVDAELTPLGRPPAAPRPLLSLLRRHVMTGMLTRLDGVLLDILLSDNSDNNNTIELESIKRPELIPISRCSTPINNINNNNNNNSIKGSNGNTRSSVTTSFDFISGVELKMAAGCLVEYASSEIGIREGPAPHASASTSTTIYSSSTAPGSGVLHHIRIAPRIKEVADLLMTPKSSLGDEEVRRNVAPSLPPGVLVQVLQKYHPDDADVSADDKLPPALIKQLRVEANTSGRTGRNTSGNNNKNFVLISEAYVPPVEEVLLEEGLIQPLSLETSADSDDELSVLEERGDVRYSLLRELWGAVRTV